MVFERKGVHPMSVLLRVVGQMLLGFTVPLGVNTSFQPLRAAERQALRGVGAVSTSGQDRGLSRAAVGRSSGRMGIMEGHGIDTPGVRCGPCRSRRGGIGGVRRALKGRSGRA